MQLVLALEHWHRCSIRVISRADAAYPRRLKKSLGHRSPSLLYFCGNEDLLHGGGLAVVGSRKVDDQLLDYTRNVGALAAAAGYTIVSGGAKGVDQASMQGAAADGGQVLGVLANNLERAMIQQDNRQGLMQQRLLLCSPFDPAARFLAWRAMDRNKLIYALSDAALVVQSDVGEGGTWNGAREQLRKFHCVPVYTRTAGSPSRGLDAWRELGALRWPEPRDAEAFRAVMEAAAEPVVADVPEPQRESGQQHVEPARSESPESALAAELLDKVAELLRRLPPNESLSAASVAGLLRVENSQAKSWLEQLVEAGKLIKTSRPVRYQRQAPRPQNSLL